jgi:hypothetical protein
MRKCVECRESFDDKFFLKPNGQYKLKCPDCNLKYKIRYLESKKNKKCPRCQSIINDNSVCCSICKELYKTKAKDKRIIARKNKLCIYCFKEYAVINFTSCQICFNNQHSRKLVDKLFTHAKARSKKTNREFSIDKTDIIIPDRCPILGIKLQENKNSCKDSSYSLDRIDNSKGYIKGNVHVISHRANQIKSSATIEELKMIVNYLQLLSP